jgi:cephalosporin-C deacetylase-like acetyl esterase
VTPILITVLFLIACLAGADDFTHTGNGWTATVGDDGFLRSVKAGQTEMLQPFPDHTSPCFVMSAVSNKELPAFDSVSKADDGTIHVKGLHLSLQYVFSEEAVKIKFQSLVTNSQESLVLYLRPSSDVTRAVDGEVDTSISPTNTWYFNMPVARWFAKSGGALTIGPTGNWTRWPYVPGGVGCYSITIYPRNSGTIEIRPEAKPSARTALVFEVRGENEDFLPPGGRPAVFPCMAENLGETDLEVGYKVTVRKYTDRSPVLETSGTFTVAPNSTSTVPLILKLQAPDVYRGEVELLTGGESLKKKHWNFCYDFAHYEPRCPKPKDFDEFWKTSRAELDKVPLDLKRTVFTNEANSTIYKLDYAVLNGERAYAWLRVPKRKDNQKLPARLELPPSGVNKLPPPPESPAVEMKLAIHGYDVDFSNLKWEPPYPWPNGRYHNFGIEKKETYFYRNVYMRCARAVDVLASLPEVDAGRIMVFGGSQGGGLSIIAAALNPKVAFCAPGFPGLCRSDWTLRYGVGSWPLNKDDIPKGQTLDQMLDTLSYFDAANFIGSIKVPIVGTMGWLDDITAAGGQIAAFGQADKNRLTLFCSPWGRHGADARTQNAFYASHTDFFAGKPVSLPKAWDQ